MGVGTTPAKQRAYVKRLADAGLAGLGFGLGFSHDKVPRALVAAAEQASFPVFEVPYPVPFIAITEAVFTRILAEQYDMLQRAVDAEHVLTRAVMDGAGIEGIAASLAHVTNGWAMLLDLHGIPLADHVARRDGTGRARLGRAPLLASRRAPASACRSSTRGITSGSSPSARRAVSRRSSRSASPNSRASSTASSPGTRSPCSRSSWRSHAPWPTRERRLQGDFFDELAAGSLSAADAARGLARFGFAAGRARRRGRAGG